LALPALAIGTWRMLLAAASLRWTTAAPPERLKAVARAMQLTPDDLLV
jgi:hypothetical protein